MSKWKYDKAGAFVPAGSEKLIPTKVKNSDPFFLPSAWRTFLPRREALGCDLFG